MHDEIDDMPQDDPDRESADAAPLRPPPAEEEELSVEAAETVAGGGDGDEGHPRGGELPAVPVIPAARDPEPPEVRPPLAGERSGERSFGTWLRRQREMRDIDLREIADKTKISLRYLKAMEQDRFELLPAPLFARGFLREYAKYVGLNADEVVNYYLSAHEGAGENDELDQTRDRRYSGSSGPATKGALMVLVLIVGVALAAYFLFWRQSREGSSAASRPPIAAPPAVEVPESTVPPPPEAESTAPIVVTLDFTQQCWIEASVDGEPVLSRLFVAGESSQLEAQAGVTLDSIGNAGGVEVQVNGIPFELGAGEGETVHGVTIDLGTVQRLRRRAG